MLAGVRSLDGSQRRSLREVKVLFLAGKGRSGGTLLGGLLGQLPGYFNAGELSRLFDTAVSTNYPCGCGLPFRECETWRAILGEADRLHREVFGVPLNADTVGKARASVVRWPNLARLLLQRP